MKKFKNGTLYHGSCVDIIRENLEQWRGKFRALVTSPPYGNLQEYSGEKTIFRDNRKSYGSKSNPGAKNRNKKSAVPNRAYWSQHRNLLNLCMDILEPDGSMWINIADYPIQTKDGYYQYMLTDRYIRCAESCGWRLVNKIIWEKIGCLPTLQGRELLSRDYEYVLHFRKKESKSKYITKPIVRSGNLCKIDTSTDAPVKDLKLALEMCKNVWRIPIARVKGYPTPFPISLVERCLMLTDLKPADIPTVIDPFFGSGQTALAATNLGWNWTGIELSNKTVSFSSDRLERKIGTYDNEAITTGS